MAFWIFRAQSIAGEPLANSLVITYLWSCTNLPYVPINVRINFQYSMCGKTICASTRLSFQADVLSTTFRASRSNLTVLSEGFI